MSDNVFTYARGEQRLLVVRATDSSGGPVALGFIVSHAMDSKGIVVDREKVGELFNALGKWLGGGDGQTYVVMCDDARTKIIAEIHAERGLQDAQWGGPEHDDTHTASDWVRYIRDQATRALVADMTIRDPEDRAVCRRARFVKIAALALAAIESFDWKSEAEPR